MQWWQPLRVSWDTLPLSPQTGGQAGGAPPVQVLQVSLWTQMARNQSGEINTEMCWADLPATGRALEQAYGLLFEIQGAC